MHVLVGSCSCPLNNSLVDPTRSRGETVTQRPPASAVHWRNVGTTLRQCTADAGLRRCTTKMQYLLTLKLADTAFWFCREDLSTTHDKLKRRIHLKSMSHCTMYRIPYDLYLSGYTPHRTGNGWPFHNWHAQKLALKSIQLFFCISYRVILRILNIK